MKTCLIVCYGYFGDHLHANAIAEHLINEGQFDVVDYVIGFPQVYPFFERNPYVRNVFLDGVGPSPRVPSNANTYDKVFQLGSIKRVVPPPVEMQLLCGVKSPSPTFYIHTNPELDELVRESYGEKTGLVIGIMSNWKERSFLFTKEQYDRAIDVPNLGYGGAHRNTDWIVNQLESKYNTIVVGTSGNVNQFMVNHEGPSLDLTASILKYCDAFVGAEGGLANLTFAVGTDTILTSDFIHQLYGPKGVIQQVPNPMCEPIHYGGPNTHINLEPYLTDEEVFLQIVQHLDNKRTEIGK
jgi:ADP-heptose:LPS heptosyltransferase